MTSCTLADSVPCAAWPVIMLKIREMIYETLESRPPGSPSTQHGFIQRKGYIYTNSITYPGFLFSGRQVSHIGLYRLVLARRLVFY